MKKRWLSLALALVFCLSLVPGVTLTAGAESATETTGGGGFDQRV